MPMFEQIERLVSLSLATSFSRKKGVVGFCALSICGLFTIFCRALSVGANNWLGLSLAFLPTVLCFGILLATGVFLNRVYYCEERGLTFPIREIFQEAFPLLIQVSYLSLPLLVTCLFSWIVMGVFYLVKEIPSIGEGIGILLSVGPFLLVLCNFLISIICILTLFFLTPHLATKKGIHIKMLEEFFVNLRKSPFLASVLFLIASFPLGVSVTLLTVAAQMTGFHYIAASAAIGIAFQWLLIMIPFAALLTPFFLFFFAFSRQSYFLLSHRARAAKQKVKEETTETIYTAEEAPSEN